MVVYSIDPLIQAAESLQWSSSSSSSTSSSSSSTSSCTSVPSKDFFFCLSQKNKNFLLHLLSLLIGEKTNRFVWICSVLPLLHSRRTSNWGWCGSFGRSLGGGIVRDLDVQLETINLLIRGKKHEWLERERERRKNDKYVQRENERNN